MKDDNLPFGAFRKPDVLAARQEAVRYCRTFPLDKLLERLPFTKARNRAYSLAGELAAELADIPDADDFVRL